MTRISTSVLFTPFSKLYILTELSANDVKFISCDRQELDLSKYISYITVNSIFIEIQPDSTNIKNDPRNTTIKKTYWFDGNPIHLRVLINWYISPLFFSMYSISLKVTNIMDTESHIPRSKMDSILYPSK